MMKGANKVYYARGLAGQVSRLLEENSWLSPTLRFMAAAAVLLACFLITAVWDTTWLLTIGFPVPRPLHAAAGSAVGRFMVNLAAVGFVVLAKRFVAWSWRQRRGAAL